MVMSMQIVKNATLVVALSFSGLGMAATQELIVPCGDNCSVADLAKIQGQTLILKAQEAKTTVEKRINELKNGQQTQTSGDQQSMASPMFNQPGMAYPGSPQMAQKKEQKAPAVSSVMGAGSNLYAVFRLDDGSELQAKEGGSLPGGFLVKKISLDEVLLSKDGKIVRAANAL